MKERMALLFSKKRTLKLLMSQRKKIAPNPEHTPTAIEKIKRNDVSECLR